MSIEHQDHPFGRERRVEARRRLRLLAETVRPAVPGEKRSLAADFALAYAGMWMLVLALVALPWVLARRVIERVRAGR